MPGRGLSARGTMPTTSYRGLSGGIRHFFPSRHYSAVRSSQHANDDNDILTASARRWVFVTFFRRSITLMSGRVLVHA
ncbi:hypothetical protein TNCV_3695881 [Trichonephila clavipes]|nr:hypothetical protein TNCV_3695881 [Trichonephila clavipes]